MYDIKGIQDCFSGLVGIRPDIDPCSPEISASLQTSESGQFFNDRNPLITIKNLKAIAPNFDGFNFPEYVLTDIYALDEMVQVASLITNGTDKFYKSLVAGNTNNALTDTNFWEETLLVSDWIENKINQYTSSLFNQVYISKKLNKNTKSIFEDIKLFDSTGRKSDTVTPSGRFVGLEIVTHRYNDLVTALDRIGLQFTEVQTDLDIYIYHSSQNDPISITQVTTTKANSVNWLDFKNELPYFSTATSAGGSWYVGYYEADIDGQAIQVSTDFSKPCSSCNRNNTTYYNLWSKYVSITPIHVGAGNIEGDKSLFDVANVIGGFKTNWGLNFSLTTKCDLTDFICRNRELFTEAIIQSVNTAFMNDMMYNTRSNDLSSDVQALAAEKLIGTDRGDKSFVIGDENKLIALIEAISFDLSDLDTPCAPCDNRRGIKFHAA